MYMYNTFSLKLAQTSIKKQPNELQKYMQVGMVGSRSTQTRVVLGIIKDKRHPYMHFHRPHYLKIRCRVRLVCYYP